MSAAFAGCRFWIPDVQAPYRARLGDDGYFYFIANNIDFPPFPIRAGSDTVFRHLLIKEHTPS